MRCWPASPAPSTEMSALRALVAQREAIAALAVWALVPAVFLFFALTLAVDPSAHLDRLGLGVAVLDEGFSTPQGQVAIGPRLVEGLRGQLRAEVALYATEAELREAVQAHDVAAGIVVPDGMTQDLQAGRAAELRLVRSDANDPLTNAFITSLASQLSTSLNSALPAMLRGEAPPPTLIAVATDNVAATTDYRFASIPATLLLPLWMAGVAFAALLARAGDQARQAAGLPWTAVSELAWAVIAAATTAAVVTVSVAAFTWRWDIDLAGLFGLLWLGLTAIAWLMLGTIRIVGVPLGVTLGVIALFVQQPVSGAAYPAAFAPDAVRWAEPVAPLHHLVEGMRNLLIGGSTTPEVAAALAVLAAAGALLTVIGAARLWLMPGHPAATAAASA